MVEPVRKTSPPLTIGRYVLHDEIASGGMASVHLARHLGPVGFARTVAIKRLHAHHAKDPDFVTMFQDEARIAARIRHPNVVATVDVAAEGAEVFLVMEYVLGESLAVLLREARQASTPLPTNVVAAILVDVLHGLHAAHEARGERGQPLGIVHRDVSPHNILVGRDGITRVVDFGVAKAASRLQSTQGGQLKGKLAYMAPEQIGIREVDRRTDVFAASIVLWEAITLKRLFAADDQAAIVARVLTADIEPPGRIVPGLPPALDEVVMRGLARDPPQRFASAKDMALALEQAVLPARPTEVTKWVERLAGTRLDARAARVAEIESQSLPDDATSIPVRGVERSTAAATARTGGTAVTMQLRDPADAPSRITEMSSSGQSAPTPARSRGRAMVIAVLAVAVVVGAAASLRRRSAPANESPSPAPSAPAASSAAADTTAPPDPSLSASATSSSQAPLPPEATSAPAAVRPPARPARPSSPSRHTGKPSCDPPYVFGADGVKRFKPECL